MAFAFAVLSTTVFGDRAIAMGTFTNTSGSSGGELNTGLKTLDHVSLTLGGSAGAPNQLAVNETLPLNTGIFTLASAADAVGVWFAIGRGPLG